MITSEDLEDHMRKVNRKSNLWS